MKKIEEESPTNFIRAAAADVGVYTIRGIAEVTGIKNTTMQRRFKDISTATVGELASVMHSFPRIEDARIGRMIREAYR
jgi:hypothetical protein